jgi:GntR family transcriptional regulator
MTATPAIRINFKSGKPAYLQIVEQVQAAVGGRTLRAGDQLPSIRELAEQLRINRNTVAKAYSELEHLGVTSTRQGLGVFIAEAGAGARLTASARAAMAHESIDAAIIQARHLGLSDAEFLRLAEARLKKFPTGKGEDK